MKILLIVSLLMTALLPSVWGSDEEIFVKLETDNQLMPLYLGRFIEDQPGFDQAYLRQLENIFQFDMGHNGTTYLVPHTKQNDVLATAEAFDHPVNSNSWTAFNISYIVLSKIKDRKLSARLFAINSDSIRAIQDISLTGELAEDRWRIHQLSDTIHKALFGKEGIATTRILYTVKMKGNGPNKWTSEIWEADYDGGNAVKLTHDGGYCVTPAYVPPNPGFTSGGYFYVSYLNGQPKVFYATFKESVGRRFCSLKGNQLMPAISRQRDQVAFVCDVAGNPDLFLQPFSIETGAIGKPRQIYATRQGVQGTPTFSPNGKQIAFVSNKDGAARIYYMDIPAPGKRLQDIVPKLISRQTRESTAPAWSPDGTKLAYCSMTGNIRQIWIYDFEQGRERQLTQGPGNKENPAWAPDSLHLVFNSTDANESELYLINLNQPQATKITSGAGEKHYPDWEPRAY